MIVELNEITQIIYFLKTLFISYCAYYTFLKMINDKKYFSMRKISGYISIFGLSIIMTIVKEKTSSFVGIIFLTFMLSCIYAITTNSNIGRSITVTLISLAFNYIIFTISIVISFIINNKLKIKSDLMNLIVITFVHLGMLIIVLRMKRFKYGISFLKNNAKNEYMDIIVLGISISTLFSTIVFSSKELLISRSLFLGFIMLVISMGITIQKTLQLYYKQKLLVQELNETKQELIETKKELKQLEEENLNFSKKSHTLAHRQKSLEHKILELTTKSEISTEEVGEVESKLEEIKKDLYKETAVVELTKTEIVEIDDMLKYMQAECIKNKIGFELQIAGNIHYMTNNFISKEDLEILLADHIKDAIIAINHTDNINRGILVRLGEIDGIYSLYIYDSGVEFEIETLKNLGKEPSTTHADEGGTGMGFMNTFDTLRKYQASLTIKEINNPTKDNYTKVLIFKFDKKGEFQITSYRQKKLLERDIQNKIYIK